MIRIFDGSEIAFSQRLGTAEPSLPGLLGEPETLEKMLRLSFEFSQTTKLYHFCHSEGAFFAPEGLALRSSEGTYAVECSAESFQVAMISMINYFLAPGTFNFRSRRFGERPSMKWTKAFLVFIFCLPLACALSVDQSPLIHDLQATRKGNKVVLTWSQPR
ncbi:MAG TPA: hypothetical protein VNV88_03310, partial [Candidatus Solibacter sp.]|nr:hypothetical protein [Candidatus Solibacter sp.]